MNSRKKKLLALAIAATTTSISALVSAQVDNYQMMVTTKVENGHWASHTVVHSEWRDVGVHYDCRAWEPDPSSVDFGQTFLQTRLCDQDQERDATYYERHSGSEEERVVSRETEHQTIQEEESRIATGERRDWVSHESTYTEWTDISGAHTHQAWTPPSDQQITGYSQTRGYEVTQERYEQKRERDTVTGEVRDSGEPVRQVRDDARSEDRSVTVVADNWVDTGSKRCGAWSPDPSTVDYGQTFSQTRDCDQDQQRVYRHQVEGADVHTHSVSRTTTNSETQQATGTRRDWQPAESTYTAWQDTGSGYGHGTWEPPAANQTSNFQQSRTYNQNQFRYEQKREQDQVTGDYRNTGDPEYRTQTVQRTQTRDVIVTASAWRNTSGNYNCGSWSPDPMTVDHGKPMTQTRTCSVDQERDWTYTADGNQIHARVQTRVSTASESRPNEGTRYRLSGNQFSAGCVQQQYVDRAQANGTTVEDEAPRPGSNYYKASEYGLQDSYGGFDTSKACNSMGLNKHAYTVGNVDSSQCSSGYNYVAMTCVVPQ